GCASVAQGQSIGFVNQRLWVQFPPLASLTGKPSSMGPTGQVDKHMRGDRLSDRPLSGSLSTTTWMGRWPSGQWHQTVNLTGLALRGFESLSAHCSTFDFRLA